MKYTLLFVVGAVLTFKVAAQCTFPPPITISIPTQRICVGEEINITATYLSDHTYQWFSEDWTILSSSNENTIRVKWNSAGLKSISALAINNCGFITNGRSVINIVDNSGIMLGSPISGNTSTCLGEYIYTLPPPYDQISNITWSISGGGSITPIFDSWISLPNSAKINWTSSGNFTITATATNNCNGLAESTNLNINVGTETKPIVSLINGISGPEVFCMEQTGMSKRYSVNYSPGVNYTWTLNRSDGQPSQSILTSQENLATVDWKDFGTSQLIVTPTNSQCVGESARLIVSVSPYPTAGTLSASRLVACRNERIYFTKSNNSSDAYVEMRKFYFNPFDGGYWTSWSNLSYTGSTPSFLVPYNDSNYSGPVTKYEFRVKVYSTNLACYSVSNTLTLPISSPQTITFGPIPDKIYGSPPFNLEATSSSGLPVSYSGGSTSVAVVSGNTVTITGAGSTTIRARQVGDDYNCPTATDISQTLMVTKAPLTVTAMNVSKIFGTINPPLTYTYSGFVNNDDAQTINQQPQIETTAQTNSSAGEYPITLRTGYDNNYNLIYVNGTLTILKANQTITFDSLDPTCPNVSFTVTATSNRGLPISYLSSDPTIASVSGNLVTTHKSGTVQIIASQSGNTNYNGASASQTLIVKPKPVVTTVDKFVCTDQSSNLSLTSDAVGAAFSWTVQSKSSNITGVTVGTTGTSNPINHTLTNTTTSSGTVVYRVTATANGCAGTFKDVTVTVNPAPSASVTGNSIICPEGSTLLTASPSGSQYTYQWLKDGSIIPGATSRYYNASAQGSYKALVTDATSTCAKESLAFIVSVSAIPTATITSSGPLHLCTNQSVTLYAPTGTGYTYTWFWHQPDIIISTSSSAVVTSPGKYSVLITNANGCTDSATVNVTSTKATIIPSGPLCSGSSVTLSAGTGTGSGLSYTYRWQRYNLIWMQVSSSPTYTTSSAGRYRLLITDSYGCSSTSPELNLTTQSNPTPTISASGDVCGTGYMSLTSSSGQSYLWSNGQTTRTITGYSGGSYRVTVTHTNGCIKSSSYYTVPLCNPDPDPCDPYYSNSTDREILPPCLQEVNEFDVDELTIYPNPANREVNVVLPERTLTPIALNLMDAHGRTVHTNSFATGEQQKTLDTSELASGLYILQFNTQQGVVRKKVMVVHEK